MSRPNEFYRRLLVLITLKRINDQTQVFGSGI